MMPTTIFCRWSPYVKSPENMLRSCLDHSVNDASKVKRTMTRESKIRNWLSFSPLSFHDSPVQLRHLQDERSKELLGFAPLLETSG